MDNIPHDIIQKIYEAALFPDRWESALKSIQLHFNWRTVNLVEFDPNSGDAKWSLAAFDIDPRAIPDYNEYYWQLDPVLARKRDVLQAHRPVRLQELYTSRELLSSEYFNDHMWATSNSSLDNVCANFAIASLELNGAGGICFSAAEPGYEGMSETSYRDFSSVAKLIAHACKISRQFSDDQTKFVIDGPTSAYNSVAAAVLDEGGKVITANDVFYLLDEKRSVIKLGRDGKIKFCGAENNAKHSEQIASVCSQNSRGHSAVASFLVMTSVGPHSVSCIPYSKKLLGNSLTFGRYKPTSIVLIAQNRMLIDSVNAELLQQRYSLTTKEAELAIALTEGRSLRELEANGIAAYETLRKRVASVLAKTECISQSALISLIAADPTLRCFDRTS